MSSIAQPPPKPTITHRRKTRPSPKPTITQVTLILLVVTGRFEEQDVVLECLMASSCSVVRANKRAGGREEGGVKEGRGWAAMLRDKPRQRYF